MPALVDDLRRIVDRMPWPDVRGRRCLAVSTDGGFLASAMERRGAAEVVAIGLGEIGDLDDAEGGPFGVVACGGLMSQLRDPIRALEAIRRVCAGELLSAERIDARLTLLSPRRPAARFRGGELVQWWIPNAAGHRRMLEAAGFELERSRRGLRHAAVLARPRDNLAA